MQKAREAALKTRYVTRYWARHLCAAMSWAFRLLFIWIVASLAFDALLYGMMCYTIGCVAAMTEVGVVLLYSVRLAAALFGFLTLVGLMVLPAMEHKDQRELRGSKKLAIVGTPFSGVPPEEYGIAVRNGYLQRLEGRFAQLEAVTFSTIANRDKEIPINIAPSTFAWELAGRDFLAPQEIATLNVAQKSPWRGFKLCFEHGYSEDFSQEGIYKLGIHIGGSVKERGIGLDTNVYAVLTGGVLLFTVDQNLLVTFLRKRDSEDNGKEGEAPDQ